MSKRLSLEEHLASAPASVRNAMMNERESLDPGAAAVVGRFFTELGAQRATVDNPPSAVFTAAAKSEATLSTLLRALSHYAPLVGTSEGRILRKTYYRQRPKKDEANKPRIAESAAVSKDAPQHWPPEWRRLLRQLRDAPNLKESTKKRHIASISRCVDQLVQIDCDGALTFLTAYMLGESFRKQGLKHKTIASYLGGLMALGKHGGVPRKDIDGIRLMIDHHLDLAQLQQKEKETRIEGLMKQGGFAFVAHRISELCMQADILSDHTAAKHHLRQTAALLGIHMNKPARTGDVSRWIIGRDLLRHPNGLWELEWVQEKTGAETEAGILWEEVSELIDELILAGRPSRLIHHRYAQLTGANWLTLSNEVPHKNLPSQRIKDAIGIPSHDLRTLAADYLRQWTPEEAANLIQTHLGHQTREAGEDYRALCDSDVADRGWKDIREKVRAWHLQN